ncbi:retrovirus-related pol polyprotein from transposon tnt 1-94 [Lasius niger]|uniref:Retrovirus-related pol polyprotein from transposon tnt 1-94 n=1 Tax=Lasius niger TaxID=67767 RepID=A0A0J7KU66_LASNI|nr:retrovirus-related pol polyprotein from transposon tnt 1-94 [Lasius niger]
MGKFFDAVDKLAAMKVEVNGNLLSIMLLYILPATFDNFRVTIESRDEFTSVDALKVKILEEYDVRAQSTVSDVIGGLAVKTNTKHPLRQKKMKKGKDSENTSKIFHCYKCGLPGYKLPNCPACNNYDKSDKSKKDSVKPPNKLSAHVVDDSYLACHTVFHKGYRVSVTLRGHVVGSWIVRPVSNTQGHRLIELQNALLVPDLRSNLMSVAKIIDKGEFVIFKIDSALVVDQNGTVKMEATYILSRKMMIMLVYKKYHTLPLQCGFGTIA